MEAKKYLKSKGYRIEDYRHFVTDHTWHDFFQIMQEYADFKNTELKREVEILKLEKEIAETKYILAESFLMIDEEVRMESSLERLEKQLTLLKADIKP